MNHKRLSTVFIVIIVGLLVLFSPIAIGAKENTPHLPASPGSVLGTAFTYQGRLTDGSVPANGSYNFRFYLWAEEAKTTLLGTYPETGTIPVSVEDGYFTTPLDFGVGIFDGDERWLEIEVNGSLLSPLQSITPAPYAIYAQNAPWSGLSGVPAGFADGTDDGLTSVDWLDILNRPSGLDDGDQDTTYSPGYGLSLDTTNFNVMTDTIQTRVNEACGSGYAIRQVNPDGSVVCEQDDGEAYYPGYGLSLVGATFSVMTDTIQTRVSGSCEVGSTIRVVNPDGTVICEPDDDTTYTPGYGLDLDAGQFSVDSTEVQDRVYGTCPADQSIRTINQDGSVICEADDDTDTTYTAGTGLDLVGTEFSVLTDTIQTRISEVCGSGYAIRQVNEDGSVVCEEDNYRTYSAGTGLNYIGTQWFGFFSVDFDGSGSATMVARSDHDHDGEYWSLTGNSGTTPGTHFLGTTDEVSLTLMVSDTAALRLVPARDSEGYYSPNIIGGYSGNWITPGVAGATIVGGGRSDYINLVTDHFGTVSGGRDNQAGDNTGSVSDSSYASVGGGFDNSASGSYSTVSGGDENYASGNHSTIGGGNDNSASGSYSTVGGGADNWTEGSTSTVAGGRGNWTVGSHSTVGGGDENWASGGYSTVGGGDDNYASGNHSTIGGGDDNSASGNHSTIGGGDDNSASGSYSTVGGGGYNTASGAGATIAGGGGNIDLGWGIELFSNTVTSTLGTICGGGDNLVTGSSAVVGGGYHNQATGDYTTIGGGLLNDANGDYATVGGGYENDATGSFATNGGGAYNYSIGYFATIPGGWNNIATGDFSFAAGHRATANHQGAFVWADSTDPDFTSSISDSFSIRATNGVILASNAGDAKSVTVGERYRDNGIIAWARVPANGTNSTERFGVESIYRISTGHYAITTTAQTAMSTLLIPLAVAEIDSAPTGAANVRIISVNQIGVRNFEVYINDGNYNLVDNDFVFMVTGR